MTTLWTCGVLAACLPEWWVIGLCLQFFILQFSGLIIIAEIFNRDSNILLLFTWSYMLDYIFFIICKWKTYWAQYVTEVSYIVVSYGIGMSCILWCLLHQSYNVVSFEFGHLFMIFVLIGNLYCSSLNPTPTNK